MQRNFPFLGMRAGAWRAAGQRASVRLQEFAADVWRRVGAAPVALKVIGLVVFPLLVASLGGGLFIRERLVALLQVHEQASVPPEMYLDLARQAIFVFVVVALFGLGLAVLFTHVLVRPLHELVEAMRRVKSGDLDAQVPVWAPDEIGEMQTEFNTMVASLRDSRSTLLSQQKELETLNRDKTRLLVELQSKSDRLHQLLHHATSAQEAERKRVARELHDEAGQSLTSILVRLKALQAETDIQVVHDRLNGLRYLTTQTLEELRRLSMDLRPTALDDLGLVAAIRWYAGQSAKENGMEITVHAADSIGRLPPDLEIVLYRAVQEGLTNIVRHARARRTRVVLERSARAVWLTIADDGQGMADAEHAGNGMGLEGMRERVALVGGRLELDSAPGAGTRIIIELPLEEEPQ
ncbi:MAG: sensor histidine kinase [Chloroflexi bacterium]|nr:sensor histidine kinase [Chloroflexota bacterium]